MKASEKYWQIIARTRRCAWYCGADIVDPNYKLSFLTYLVIACITIYFLFSFYTIYVKISQSWHVVLEALCMSGSVVQGLTKLIIGIVFRKHLREMCSELGHKYSEYENKGKKYEDLLNKAAARSYRALQLLAFLYFGTITSIFFVPVVYLIFKKEKIFVMQFLIPGLNPDTNFGYSVTSSVHITCLFFGGFGNFAGDMFFHIFILNISIFGNIMDLKIGDLNKSLQRIANVSETRLTLLDIFRWHQEYFRYINKVNEVFFWVVFIQILTSSFSVALTAFIIVTGAWPAGYSYIALAFGTLLNYCILGTIAELSNDKVLECIQNSNWYELECKDQIMLQIMLINAQNPNMLTVGGFVPLSVSTGLQVTKTIYSYLMMLLNFVE